jgi:hypothetical protein
MSNHKLTISDFETEKLSKDQEKTVCGGDTDPTIGAGKGLS